MEAFPFTRYCDAEGLDTRERVYTTSYFPSEYSPQLSKVVKWQVKSWIIFMPIL